MPVPTAPDDEQAGVEPLLGDHEPGGPLALRGHGRVVQFADDERGRVVVRRTRAMPAACRRLRRLASGRSQTLDTESVMLPARSTATPGARKYQRWIARWRPGSWWAIRSRYGLPPGPGNGERNARQPSATSATPMRTSVHGLTGTVDLPVGTGGWERPRSGGEDGAVRLHPPRCRSRHAEMGGRSQPRPGRPDRQRRSGSRGATAGAPATWTAEDVSVRAARFRVRPPAKRAGHATDRHRRGRCRAHHQGPRQPVGTPYREAVDHRFRRRGRECGPEFDDPLQAAL